jgi:hypothetical protein
MVGLRKTLLTAAAAAVALGSAAPAFADGGRYNRGHHGYYGGGYHHKVYGRHYAPRHYYGSRHYRHGRGHLSGAEAAFIALGIVGGVVLIDRALEREQNRYAYEPRYAPPPRDSYYRRDDRPYSYDDDLGDDDFYDDGELAGAANYAPDERRYNYGAAYNDCKAETRDAARDSGVTIALPAKPNRIEEIDDGAAVRFTASYLAQDSRGEWRRTMVCEADENGVRFLEIV